jgi:hypothetical protein
LDDLGVPHIEACEDGNELQEAIEAFDHLFIGNPSDEYDHCKVRYIARLLGALCDRLDGSGVDPQNYRFITDASLALGLYHLAKSASAVAQSGSAASPWLPESPH